MIDPATGIPEVGRDETLARYVLQSSHVRRSTQTVKADAFVPHPRRELSVTRHLMATEDELWSVGEDVAVETRKTLYGRGDVSAATCLAQGLEVQPAPIPKNPNHANIGGWPMDKPAQKIIALEIAATAVFVARA